MIDSLSGFELALAPAFREDFRESLYRLVDALTTMGVTVLLLAEATESTQELRIAPPGVTFLADGIILQRYLEIDGDVRKVMAVIKLRGSDHHTDFRSYEVMSASEGLVVKPPLREYQKKSRGGGMWNRIRRTPLDGRIDPDPLPDWLTQADVDYYVSQFKNSGFRGPLNRYRNSQRDYALLPELSERKVEQPALFIAGERDPVLNFVAGSNMLDRMGPWYTDLRGKILIPGAGHWVQQEKPQAVNEAMLSFLRSL